MSRIAKLSITILSDVKVQFNKRDVIINGKNGKLFYRIHESVDIQYVNDKLTFKPYKNCAKYWAIAGTTRSLLNNMIIGVTTGFTKKLQLVGIGYRASISDNVLSLLIGFSHPVLYKLPKEITAECLSQTEILLKSANKQIIGQVAADIRSYRLPDPYKGKGIQYCEEIIRIKEAKKK